MGVLKVNVGTAAVPDWRKAGCGGGAGGFVSYTANVTSGAGLAALGDPVIEEGDLLLAFVTTYSQSTTTAATGWTFLRMDDTGYGTFPGGGAQRTSAYWKLADSTDAAGTPSWTFGTNDGNNQLLEVLACRGPTTVVGHSGATVWDDTPPLAPLVAPSVTAGGLLVTKFGWGNANDATATPLTTAPAMTQRGFSAFTNRIVSEVYDEEITGATGTRSGTPPSYLYGTAQSFALSPGPAGATGRLKLWDGTQWLKECCDGDTGHPLKVNIGTADAPDWVVAACMTPA